jgi:hypothetical protein
MNQRNSILMLSILALLVGCADPDDPEDDPTGEAEGSLISWNALNPNALSPNALNPNGLDPSALNPSALSPSALSPSALSPSALAAIQAPGSSGTLSRQLLKYTVECAFTPSQSFSFSWTDSSNLIHDETYYGLLGLEPEWSSRPLSAAGQEWVSACLAARVNWYGVQVTISVRAVNHVLSTSTSVELSDYDMLEGAFWGNLFSASPSAYACHHAPNVSYSRSVLRDCAVGHLDLATGAVQDCGMIHVLGSCADTCTALASTDMSYSSCSVGVTGPVFSRLMTVYLQ